MKTVFIIHGIYGHPEENWFPWLKEQLQQKGYQVFVPRFPSPDKPIFSEWLEYFQKNYQKYLTPDSIVVGHSLGVAFLLSLLENYPVVAAFFVASVSGVMGNKFDPEMKTFTDKIFDWKKIKRNSQGFYLFQSDNDPYISMEKAEEFAGHLGVDLIVVKDAGHFNEAAGYTQFDLLLDKIQAC